MQCLLYGLGPPWCWLLCGPVVNTEYQGRMTSNPIASQRKVNEKACERQERISSSRCPQICSGWKEGQVGCYFALHVCLEFCSQSLVKLLEWNDSVQEAGSVGWIGESLLGSQLFQLCNIGNISLAIKLAIAFVRSLCSSDVVGIGCACLKACGSDN
jgi:hypothetical protein